MAVFTELEYTPTAAIAAIESLPAVLENRPGTEALNDCRSILLQDVSEHFSSKTGSDGTPWPARKNLKQTHPLLILSSLLFQSATGNAAGRIDRVTDRDLTFGVDKGMVPYAGVHQHGFGNIPQREYLWVSDEAEESCAEKVAEHVQRNLFG